MSSLIQIDKFFTEPPFLLKSDVKDSMLLTALNSLNNFHSRNCYPYHRILNSLWPGQTSYLRVEDIPFLPVRLFKKYELMSVPKEQVIKTMNSSGTGGQQVSQIFLDKETATLQVKVLSKIVGDFIGPKRLPMLIIDAQSTVSSRYKFSARTAGILGFSMFGRDVTFALDDQMQLNLEVVKDFLIKHEKEEILIFGFTFMVWRYFLLEIEKSKMKINIGKGILIHGGGWKQMLRDSVSNDEFKRRLKESIGIAKVHNYYGMVEQTGSIFMECEHGHLHASTFSEIVIRDPITFKPKQPNAPGLIQLLSVIPKSYPGHSILSEDIGQSLGVDDCACKRNGQYFKVHGRLKNAEIRGCSDTYSA